MRPADHGQAATEGGGFMAIGEIGNVQGDRFGSGGKRVERMTAAPRFEVRPIGVIGVISISSCK